MKKKLIITTVCFFSTFYIFSQNIKYALGLIDTLTMPGFYGRGYVNSGDKKAAEFIIKHLREINVRAFGEDYIQTFNIEINTFPGIVDLVINEKKLLPGYDYVVSPDARQIDTVFKTKLINEKTIKTPFRAKQFNNFDFNKKAIIIDTGFKDRKNNKLDEAGVLINILDKDVSWHVSGVQNKNKQIKIDIRRNALPKKVKKIAIKIDSKLIDNYQTQNVVGFLPGTLYPDTFIVFGAHYDHLGMMGDKTYFPGANDNASGTAMLLDIARYFSDTSNMGKYSIAVMFFAAEEAGLLGSEYYTNHPLFPLKNIKFMLNIDMVGTGSDGIKVVNGSIFKEEFEKLKLINQKENYLKTVSERGEAANSDHYYFYKNGVKSFFIYTLGNEHKEYHTVNDKAAILPLTKYSEVFRLIIDFVNAL